MSESFLNGKVELHCGDCLAVLPTLAENSIDSVVCDPPYHLTSIVRRFGSATADDVYKNVELRKTFNQGASPHARAAKGFMGKKWDGGDIAFQVATWAAVYRVLKPGAHLLAFSGTRTYHRMACAIEDAGFEIRDQVAWTYGSGFPKSHNIGDGRGTALKPAWEPIVLARKPLSESSIATNVLKFGTGALNIDGCRISTDESWEGRDLPDAEDGVCWGGTLNASSSSSSHPLGRWPANFIHDGSDEVVVAFPDAGGGFGVRGNSPNWGPASNEGGTMEQVGYGDSGSAARFFYTAKADSDDRLGSKHPTVKPLDLIQYLCRLITPPCGLILDPFAGTGTAGEAAWREGFSAILIEREEEYQNDIRRRMKLAFAGPDERARESIKEKTKDKPLDAGPLFGGSQKTRGGQTDIRKIRRSIGPIRMTKW